MIIKFIIVCKVNFFSSFFVIFERLYHYDKKYYENIMKILIIDNYDSFTYNIAHYVEQFAEVCKVIKIDKINIEQIKDFDKIILSPGPGLPNERPIQNQIIDFFHPSKPILGICLGHQALAEYFGAKLYNMPHVHHGIARQTLIDKADYLWTDIPNEFNSGRYHSWAVNSKNMPKNIEIIASDKETNSIMAFRHNKLDIRALQFHPESILTEYGLKIIENWVKH